MELYYLKIIESLIIISIYILVRIGSNKVINKNLTNKLLHRSRGKIVKKAVNITLLIVCLSLILIVWGVNQSDLAAYVGSILTVVGVAFFAQWSILSNITSSIIIYFNHSVKIDEIITIMGKKTLLLLSFIT